MQTQLSLPTVADFFETKLVEINDHTVSENGQHMAPIKKESDALKYSLININFRCVLDYTELNATVTVIDESKYDEYLKEREEFNLKHGMQAQFQSGPLAIPTGGNSPMGSLTIISPPKVPTRQISILGTLVFYYSGQMRTIVDNYNDFKEAYNNYLTKTHLDINPNKPQ